MSESVEIAEGVFWLGSSAQVNGISSNIYLMVDQGEAVLIGAGPVTAFSSILSALKELCAIEELSFIILPDYDPALCGAVTFFEKAGFTGKIVSHFNNAHQLAAYGIVSEIVFSNLSANRLNLKSGREIRFINTPYAKSAGSIMAHDAVSNVLFSGELFSSPDCGCGIFADEASLDEMVRYHSRFISSNRILEYYLREVNRLGAKIISPGHGPVIRDGIAARVTALAAAECGEFFQNLVIEPDLAGSYVDAMNELLERGAGLLGVDEVSAAFAESDVELDHETGLVKLIKGDPGSAWEKVFRSMLAGGGVRRLLLLEKDIAELAEKYGVRKPEIYNSSLYQLDVACENVRKENEALVESLKSSGIKVENILAIDPLSRVYKEDVFRENLLTDLSARRDYGISYSFFIVEADNLQNINQEFGRDTGDEIILNMAYVLKNFKRQRRDYVHHLVFRLNGPGYVYYVNDLDREEALNIAEEVRAEFRDSLLFVTGITVSCGFVHSDDFPEGGNPEELLPGIIDVAVSRLRLALHGGGDSVCSESDTAVFMRKIKSVLIVDPDENVRLMMQVHLAREGFEAVTCVTGDEAPGIVDAVRPSVIVSSLHLPKLDGFALRKRLLDDSVNKDIPFILISSVKDDGSVVRAQSLGIYHYFKKPFSVVEMVGLIKALTRSGT